MTRFTLRFLSCMITSDSGRLKSFRRFSCSNELVVTHTCTLQDSGLGRRGSSLLPSQGACRII